MQSTLTVVGIQSDLVWENAQKNRENFQKSIDKITRSVDLIVLPEMFTTGFTMYPSKVAETMDGSTVSWMQTIAQEKNCAVTGSLVIQENNGYYNRLLFVHPSGKIDTYDKKHLFTLAGEEKVYTAGTQRLIVDFKGWKICPLICYDLRFPVWSRNTEDYDLLLYMASWPTPRIEAWNTLLKARAIENMSYVLGVNRIGTDANGYTYSGNSLILNYLGELLGSLPDSQAGIVTCILDKTVQEKTRKKLGFLEDKDNFRVL